MSNFLYISNYNVASEDGIVTKINRQFNQLSNAFGLGMRLVKYTGKVSKNNDLTFVPGVFIYIYAAIAVLRHRFHFMYIRNPHGGLDTTFLPILLMVCKLLGVKVVLDVPAYPYDDECQGWVSKYSLFMHRCLRPMFKFFLTGVVYNGPQLEHLWGVSAKRIFNCINSDSIQTMGLKPDDKLKFIVMASMNQWHGYDRLLLSIAKSYTFCLQNIELHMYGEGPALPELKKLVAEYQLDDVVTFHGHVNQQILNDSLCGPAIGIDSLGRHRAGGNYNDSLKSKEYLARGMPIVKSHQDDSVDGLDYVYTIDGDDSLFSIESLVEWYWQNNFIDKMKSISNASKARFDCGDALIQTVKRLIENRR